MADIRVITTDAAKNRYWDETEVERVPVLDCMHVINVFPEMKGQIVEGFGGAITEAAAESRAKLNEQDQKRIMEDCYGQDGLRYNMARVTIHSCDFGLGNYTYVKENDMDLSSFSLEHDQKTILPFIKEVKEVAEDEVVFFASPWSPPAYMKTNGEMNHGGYLKKEFYALWAKYFVKYINAMAEEGIEIESVSVQNEPMATQTWDSCIYESDKENDFVKNYLGPAFKKAKIKTKIFIWDHNKEEMFDRVNEVLSDKKAQKYVDGVAIHWYTGDHFEAIDLVRSKYPELEIFFTEGCVEYSRFADSGETQKAEMYAHDMLGNLAAGAHAILDWNLILDEKGGPNHVGNFCAAPLMLNEEGSYEKRLSYYYIGQFSRYIKRGAIQIALTRYTDKIEAVAFLNPDDTRVLVLLNKQDEKVEVSVREKGKGANMFLDGHSITTLIY